MLKVFKTTNNDILTTQDIINRWLEGEKITNYTVSVVNGASYSNKNSTYVAEVEIFIIISYSKDN